ncbi:MAG: hypothetical protein A3K65_04395 [Euryarchaeota archaeon RBG_16_68_12]|nr:MAG: hypothetical protein A3K65_04395 [Euryarchaeota archaeon RBG_16_68_12]
MAPNVESFPCHRARMPSGIITACHPPSRTTGQGSVVFTASTCWRSKTRWRAWASSASEKRNRKFSEIVRALKMNRISSRSVEFAVPTRPSVLRVTGNPFSSRSARSIRTYRTSVPE